MIQKSKDPYARQLMRMPRHAKKIAFYELQRVYV